MRYLYLFIILSVYSVICQGQDIDITLSSPESGTKTHQARNSITFAPNYSYTPNGGTMTAEIVNPVISGNATYNYTVVDPETRTLNTSYEVGTTNGTFNVNSIGAATYTIPIDVPTGINGLQPKLSLTYNSLTGTGVAGYGWNLTGLSAVTRSPKTYYHDGESKGVDLTSTDRFSLDGQRLVCFSGTYGQNNSFYKTEHDLFSLIQCYAYTDYPYQFEVQTKTGLTYQYGYTDDADQTATGTNQIISWYVNKITDVYGNHIDFSYFNDEGNIYIANISYGQNSIVFFYKERSDKTTAYLKGLKFEQNLLLDRIEVKYNDNIINKYQFKYNYPVSNYNRHSVLNEVIQYGLNGSRLNSTAFTYQTPDDVTFSQTVYNTTHNYISYKSKLTFGDFNGDGRKDVFCVDNPDVSESYSGWKMYTSNGDNTFSLTGSGNFPFNNSRTIYKTKDLNGDNIDDLLISLYRGEHYVNYDKYYSYDFYYAINTGNSFELSPLLTSVDYPMFNVFSGELSDYRTRTVIKNIGTDFDGDGLNDYFIRMPDRGYRIYGFSYVNGTLSSSMTPKYSGSNIITYGDIQMFTDFNGDGKAEIMTFDENGYKLYELQGSNLVQIRSSSTITKDHHLRLGDFNGDGKTDVFMYGYSSYDWSSWQICLSTGTGFKTNYIDRKKTNLKDDLVRTGDFNGDGCTDIMAMADDENAGNHHYYITKNGATDFYSYNYSGQYHSHNYFIEDFDGDGRDEYLVTDGKSPWWNGYMIFDAGTKNKYLLEKTGNGLGQLTKISYKSLSQTGAPYTKGTGAAFPAFDFQGALPVVTSVLTDNGVGTQNSTNYSYEGIKIHRQGKGFLCMAKQSVIDVANNMSTETNFEYHPDKFFPKLTSTINKAGNTTLSTTNNIWAYNSTATGVIFPYISSSTQSDSITGHSVTTTFNYDNYGNAVSIQKDYSSNVTETTTNTYYPADESNWITGKIKSSTISYENGNETISNTVSYTYDSNGILKPDMIKYYEGTNKYYFKDNDYDSNGNLTKLTVGGSGVSNRITEYTYYPDGINVKTVKDPLEHLTEYFYNTYGRLTSEKDFLNNTTSYTYDDIGRTLSETFPDGLITTTSYNWGLTGGPTHATYYIQQSGNDGSLSKVWHDKIGREIRSDVKGFNGSFIYNVTEYNSKGQLYRISEPSTSTSPSLWSVHTYDALGRISGITRPTGRNTTYSYSVNKITETTGDKVSWKETDSQGLVTTAHDNGGDITYTYYPNGKPKTITAPGGIATVMEYDIAGNQIKLIDPSANTIVYSYDAYGQIKTQKNARNQTTTFNYLPDGRIDTKTTPEGISTHSYNSNKQLTGITMPNGVNRTYAYDNLGRVNSITETIDNINYTTNFTFDKGRLKTRSHPSGIVETMNYNGNGYLETISAGGAVRWRVNDMNARGQVTGATYGNNLTATFGFDDYGFPEHTKTVVGTDIKQDYGYNFNPQTGNLNWRRNNLVSKRDSFAYDDLDRLTNVYGPQNLTMNYFDNGNIKNKSDISTADFTYDSNLPYALSSLKNSYGVIPAAPQSATYTSFEQVSTIDEDDYHATFTYNSDDQRCKMEISQQGSALLTRIYVGSRYIKEAEGSTTKEYTWIGGDAYSAPVLAVKQNGNTQYFYLLRDYLGSITHVVDASNNVVAKYSFDVWGRRRDKDDWHYTLNNEPDLLAARGFTGHEYLPYFNLINMNGRLYDPLVGRFLSPDNYVQLPDFTQNFNRYSYCINNPLRYTDPNGEIFLIDDLILGAIGGIVNLVTNLGNINNVGQAFAYFGVGFVSGAVSEYVSPVGSAALMGAGNAALGSYYATGRVDAGAVLQGAVTSAAFSAITIGLTSVISPYVSNVTSKITNSPILQQSLTQGVVGSGVGAVGGGIGSVMNGDNFWQGAGQGAIWGGGIGFATGAYSGFRYAKSNRIDPWTGEKIHAHHSDPIFMGGDRNQKTTDLKASTHRKLHKDMNDFLYEQKDQYGNHMRPQRNNKGVDIQENFLRPERVNSLQMFYDNNKWTYPRSRYDFYKNNGLKWKLW